jgi:penicillin G amidase
MREKQLTIKKRGRLLLLSGWTAGILMLLAVTGTLGGALWIRHSMQASLPLLDGQDQLPGLTAEVRVRRDQHGVPHLAAQSLDDLFLAQGYVTAQDRLWQMDMLRRNAGGELAELLGPSLLEHDKVQRQLLMRASAQRIAATLSDRDRHFLEDYAKGVNQYIERHQDALPAEFHLLAYHPRPWQPSDSILIGLMMVQTLDQHFQDKLGKEQVTAHLGAKLTADLYPTESWRDHPPTTPVPDLTAPQPVIPDVPLDESQTKLEDLVHLHKVLGGPPCEGCAIGSNEWAISGTHTASGKPLLSNDMHLDLSIPNIWYEADLKGPNFHAAGVTLPGMPFVIAGHNDHIAWGITALYGDTQDLYVENLNGHGEYESADGWRPIEHAIEVIHVRGRGDVTIDVQKTNHGPIITPILEHESRPLALRWTVYENAIGGIPLFDLNSASNWTDFRAAMQKWWGPTQNVVYADDQGHIGYQAVGYIPLRPQGIVEVPITDRQHEWQGYIPFEALPSTEDPAAGMVATANSRVTPDGYPYALTLGWASPYRTERIYKWLAGKDKLTRQDMLKLQMDVYSEVNHEIAQRMAYAIDHAKGADERLKQAADLMRTWDGSMTEDSAAASVVVHALGALWPLILEPKLGANWQAYQWPSSSFAEEEIIMHASPDWLPRNYQNWDALLTDAVKKGMEKDNPPYNIKNWTYGSWHVIDLEHPLFGLLPWFKDWTGTGRHSLSGDHSTVKAAGHAFGPSQRFTMDWSDVDGSTENIVLGQSGNPLSPYYRDQWSAWYQGTTFALPFSDSTVQAATVHTLQLVP